MHYFVTPSSKCQKCPHLRSKDHIIPQHSFIPRSRFSRGKLTVKTENPIGPQKTIREPEAVVLSWTGAVFGGAQGRELQQAMGTGSNGPSHFQVYCSMGVQEYSQSLEFSYQLINCVLQSAHCACAMCTLCPDPPFVNIPSLCTVFLYLFHKPLVDAPFAKCSGQESNLDCLGP